MITLAREAAGLTQAALANSIGVSQAHLSKIEHGLDEPTDELLARLSKECEVPLAFFEQPEVPVGEGLLDLFHKKRATLPAKPLKRAHASANVARLEVIRLFRDVELTDVEPFPIYPIDEYGDPGEIAGRVRATWRAPAGPLPDLVGLIEATGTPVVAMDLGHEKLSAISMPGPGNRFFVVINDRLPASHQRFALAHELGHLVMHSGAVAPAEAEEVAQRFASCLLMPEADILPQLRNLRFKDVGPLKPVWRVSLAALIRRAKDLGTITDRQYRTYNMQLNKLPGGRKREPGEFEPEQPRLVRSVLNHYTQVLGLTEKVAAQIAVVEELVMRERYFGEPRRTPSSR